MVYVTPLILETLFFHCVLISNVIFLTKLTSKEVDKLNGNFMGVTAYIFPRSLVSRNILDIEIAFLLEVLPGL